MNDKVYTDSFIENLQNRLNHSKYSFKLYEENSEIFNVYRDLVEEGKFRLEEHQNGLYFGFVRVPREFGGMEKRFAEFKNAFYVYYDHLENTDFKSWELYVQHQLQDRDKDVTLVNLFSKFNSLDSSEGDYRFPRKPEVQMYNGFDNTWLSSDDLNYISLPLNPMEFQALMEDIELKSNTDYNFKGFYGSYSEEPEALNEICGIYSRNGSKLDEGLTVAM